MIDRETIQKIMDASNIVDVVSEFVTLRRAGVNYRGLCPFHDEKTPSFMFLPPGESVNAFPVARAEMWFTFLWNTNKLHIPRHSAGWLANII